ncbi:MAG: glycosyltransferase family 2 protein [Clostridiales bacterium]|nr:glycosyltransferase family 2 protein [Clostridiales bacterium]
MLEIVSYFNFVLALTMSAAYFYQLIYLMYGVVSRKKPWIYVAQRQHRYAVLVSARNEEEVIGELIGSLRAQNYPRELLDICVVADNCTDRTAQVAREAGAIVYERFDTVNKGKGYALGYLLHELRADVGESGYDGFFVFDADNIIDPNFVAEMNKVFDTGEYQALTSYRNSKNFADNWITAGYGLWFMREARYLNFPRMLIGTNCAISGTGFLISADVVRENAGWPYHLLTEDIEFSVNCALKGQKIGYCDTAVLYDEQPTSFRQSWDQRLRWSKGFYQVDFKYGLSLVKGMFTNKEGRFACYDMLMTVAPGMLLTLAMLVINLLMLVTCFTEPAYIARRVFAEATGAILSAGVMFYLSLFTFGMTTTITEWSKINATTAQKIRYAFTFPLFLFTYVPIAVVALVRKVEWRPIKHTSMGTAKLGGMVYAENGETIR